MQRLLVRGTLAMALAAGSAYPAAAPDAPGIPAQMVVTVVSDGHGQRPATLQSGELSVLENKTSVPVVGFERLAGDSAAMQLFVLLDDSTRSSSLGTQLRDLKGFLESLPATTQVAVGYMRNGTFALAQSFTTDHQKAANSLRLPLAVPGENGSPYFALSELVQRWPSHEPTGRRAVLMFTDGVDRYFSQSILDDPYVDAAFHAAQKRGVLVYSVYLRGAGLYGRGSWTTNIAQSRLMEVSDETGGYAYFQDLTDPVSISPFLDDLQNRFDNQYQVTIRAQSEKGFQPVKLRTELPGAKVSGPAHIYVP
ncbi:MAG TPA: hypothetical protein VMH81_37150 [Bryobacteraceae bacterium]|nr:hypothetical protein [Bryobacteraceae bacterium]